MKYSYLLALSILLLMSCNNEVINTDDLASDQTLLKTTTSIEMNVLKDAPFHMGAALGANNLRNNVAYRNTVLTEMNSISAENAMKMSVISLGRKQYNFTDADYIVNFGYVNNLRVHGHTLIWARKEPPTWIKNFVGNKEDWKTIMKEYIQDVVGRYKGKVASWDVLNEIIADNGSLVDCVWLQNIGPEYIELALTYAHEADPDALLFYNDYGHEYSNTRRTKINYIVDSLAQKGVPIHGLGLQMHSHINRPLNDFRTAIFKAAETGLLVHVSELDILVNTDKIKTATFTDQVAQAQKASYKAVAKAMAEIPASQQFGITMWGVHDPSSWASTNPDWPLLFNSNFEKKPAYEGLVEGIYAAIP